MYGLGVRRDFVAQHFLTVGDPGPEHAWHSHRYRLEAILHGRTLDEAGYLVDIGRLEARLDELIDHYRDRTLNELPEFEGLNPSLEHFARIACERLAETVDPERIETILVILWENDDAWASWETTP